MSTPLNRDRFAKLLGMLGADNDGERLNALRMAETELSKAGMNWFDVGQMIIAGAARPTNASSPQAAKPGTARPSPKPGAAGSGGSYTDAFGDIFRDMAEAYARRERKQPPNAGWPGTDKTRATWEKPIAEPGETPDHVLGTIKVLDESRSGAGYVFVRVDTDEKIYPCFVAFGNDMTRIVAWDGKKIAARVRPPTPGRSRAHPVLWDVKAAA